MSQYLIDGQVREQQFLSTLFPNLSWDWNVELPQHLIDHLGLVVIQHTTPITVDSDHKCVPDGYLIEGNIAKEKWTAIPLSPAELQARKQSKVPTQLAMWQARDVMIKYVILDDVINFINNIQDPIERKRAQSKFEFSNTVRRDDPLLNFVANQAGYTKDQIDDWFIEGDKL